MRRANPDRANLVKASLYGVDASGASLHGATIAGASLLNVNLCGADLTDATVEENSFKARLDRNTVVRGMRGSVFGPVELGDGVESRMLDGEEFEAWIRERGGDVSVIVR
ncbi:pentapeptide repeat-containing protein [Streptomyces sp. N35]|uniref:pentapeptide repeat-containing protein n=1 Tax=Streptomyces sp. N35 TaxID=2795730 RepID=UPI001F35C12D|nr:pentapeptide repeat-containing protein [Streptomyces sp. N35]